MLADPLLLIEEGCKVHAQSKTTQTTCSELSFRALGYRASSMVLLPLPTENAELGIVYGYQPMPCQPTASLRKASAFVGRLSYYQEERKEVTTCTKAW